MTDSPDSMLVHCGWCRHEWLALKLPMPMHEAVEKVAAMRCPECNRPSSEIYCGHVPTISDDIVARLRYAADRAKREYPEVFRVSEEIAYEAADRIEKLEAAIEDMAQYISRADWMQLKKDTHEVWDLGGIND